jgi:hypothetical protein
VKWSSSSMYVVILSLYISNNMNSPVDVGGFAEPRQNIVSVCFTLRWATISTPPVLAWGSRNPQQRWQETSGSMCVEVRERHTVDMALVFPYYSNDQLFEG